jgi:hypothetical protein
MRGAVAQPTPAEAHRHRRAAPFGKALRLLVHQPILEPHRHLSLRLPGDACPHGGLTPVGMASLTPPNPKPDYGATSNTPTAPIS